MTDLDPNAEIRFGVTAHEVDPTIYLCLISESGVTHIALDYDQAFSTAQLIIDALTKIASRSGERAALDALYALQPESPRHEHTDRP